MTGRRNSNRILVGSSREALEELKYDVSEEFGIQLGAEQTSRANGSVGGEMTKRLVEYAESVLRSNRF